MIAGFEPMARILPESRKRGVEIKHWTPDPLTLVRARMHGNHLREGHTYTQLLIDGSWMSDTRDEMVANSPVAEAKGRVLIVGLGLGMALHRVLKNSGVTHVDVIERDKRVGALVWPKVGAVDKRAHLITTPTSGSRPEPRNTISSGSTSGSTTPRQTRFAVFGNSIGAG
jgi:hypothetical protein